jgi:hypothetical protein
MGTRSQNEKKFGNWDELLGGGRGTGWMYPAVSVGGLAT